MSTAASKTVAAGGAPKKGRKSASLPSETVEYLKAWMMSPEHVAHPYPTDHEKAQIMRDTGIELKQLTNWFVNNRKRYWKPRVEAKLQNKSALGIVHRGRKLWAQPKHKAPLGLAVPALAPMDARGSPASGQVSPKNQLETASPAPSLGEFGLASAAMLPMVTPRRDSDPHTISACNSDDESLTASSVVARPSSFGAASAWSLGSRLSHIGEASEAVGTTDQPLAGAYRRHEEVDVHVLRPQGFVRGAEEALPTLRDLTIKKFAPKERILATFKCPISYTVPYDIEHDSKKVQSRRDGEVLRVKKHYLNLYLASRGIHSANSMAGSSNIAASPEFSSTGVLSVHSVPPIEPSLAPPTASSRSRSFASLEQTDEESSPSPLKRARTDSAPQLKGEDRWRSLCMYANSVYCESLPDLDEAARMFGYAS